jgi:signal transduction histidine kinase
MSDIVSADTAGLWNAARQSVTRLEKNGLTARTIFGYAALGLSVVFVILATLFLGANIARLRESFAWVQHTNQVLNVIGGIQENLVQGESDVRAYILSGDAAFRDEYQDAHRALLAELDDFEALISDNPVQVRNIAAMRPLIARRLRQLDESLRSAAAHPAPRDLARTSERRRVIGAIQRGIVGLRGTELSLLVSRQQQTERQTRAALFLALVAAGLAVISGAIGAVVISRERARRRSEAMELELMHKQRELLMDRASAMLAHEINQPLTAATNYLNAANRLAAGAGVPRLSEAVQKAGAQILRAGEIIRRLRKFIDSQTPEHRIENPEALIAEAISLLGTLDSTVRLVTAVAPQLPAVVADSVQIQQVLVNLMRNAIEAMQDRQQRDLHLGAEAGPSGDVVFSVRDTGVGISSDVARKLFRPMASTKRTGMGVGLSICHTIVLAHGGRIWAEPAEQGGAVFRFTLPVSADREQAA